MSRYIDADAYERELRTSNIIHHYGEQIVNKIHSAPSIDIVRCSECKWRKAKMMPKSVKCLFSGKADDFCSYGERKSDE